MHVSLVMFDVHSLREVNSVCETQKPSFGLCLLNVEASMQQEVQEDVCTEVGIEAAISDSRLLKLN